MQLSVHSAASVLQYASCKHANKESLNRRDGNVNILSLVDLYTGLLWFTIKYILQWLTVSSPPPPHSPRPGAPSPSPPQQLLFLLPPTHPLLSLSVHKFLSSSSSSSLSPPLPPSPSLPSHDQSPALVKLSDWRTTVLLLAAHLLVELQSNSFTHDAAGFSSLFLSSYQVCFYPTRL